jgi:hypothetical protein
MTVSSGFFNALNNDRTYDAIQMSSIFDGVVADGVFSTVGSALLVGISTGMNVSVGSGRAWFNHVWVYNDGPLVVAISTSEIVLNRIDIVCLEVDSSDGVRAASIKVIKGTPGTVPVAPTLTNTTYVHQYPLAHIYVAANVTTITAPNITNKIGTVSCPFAIGAVQNVSTDDLLAQWNAEFDVWFEAMKGQLTGDAAANLQLQVTNIAQGWIADTVTPTYSSVDGPTGILSYAADVTAKFFQGMRLKFNQTRALTYYWTFNTSSAGDVGSPVMTNIGTPTYTAAKFGNGLTLNGSTQALQVTDHANMKPGGAWTIGFWTKQSTVNITKTYFQSYSKNTAVAGINISNTGDNVTVVVGNNTGTVLGTNYSIVKGKTSIFDTIYWHHVVVTYRNNFIQIYLDGKLDGSGYCVTPVFAATNYVRIGCECQTGTNAGFYQGQIDDLFIINGYAIDEAWVLNKYRSVTPQGTGDLTITKMAIITEVGAYTAGSTLVTAYFGLDYALTSGTITLPYYSIYKVPNGFPTNPNKWTEVCYISVNRTQTSPVADNWYNFGQLDVPIGVWNLGYSAPFYINGTVGGAAAVYTVRVDLSIWNAAQDSSNLSLASVASNTLPASAAYQLRDMHSRSSIININAKTPYYLNGKSSASSTTLVLVAGEAETVIYAQCALL